MIETNIALGCANLTLTGPTSWRPSSDELDLVEGQAMNTRRKFLAGLAVAPLVAPIPDAAADSVDPLSALLNEYKAGMALFQHRSEAALTSEEEIRLFEETYGPSLDRLLNDPPVPTTSEGAKSALQYALDDDFPELLESLSRVVVRYLSATVT